MTESVIKKVLAKEKSCDLGLVIALEEELDVLLSDIRYESEWDAINGEYFYRFSLGLGNRNYACVAILIGGMGPEKAALSCQSLIYKYSPATIVSLGIAGSLSKDVHLCDVVVGTQIDGYHQDAKVTQDLDGEVQYKTSRDVFKTSPALSKHVKNLKFANKALYDSWLSTASNNWELTIPKDCVASLASLGATGKHFKIHIGNIASGPLVVSSDKFVSYLLGLDRKYLAVEMEAIGVMQSAFGYERSTVVIRGISDYSNSTKNELDEIGKGAVRVLAMKNACDFIQALADACLFEYGPEAENRARWKIILEGTLRDHKDFGEFLAEIEKLGLLDKSIRLEEVSSGSIILSFSSAPAMGARMQSLIEFDVIDEINGLVIQDFQIEEIFDIESDIEEAREYLKERDGNSYKRRLITSSNEAYSTGNYRVARTLFEQLFYVQKMDGGFNKDSLTTLTNLAQSYRRLGDLSEAKRLLDIAITERQKLNRSNYNEHELLVYRSNRVELLNALGRPSQALSEAEDVLARQSMLFGSEHEDSLRTKNNLAEALRLTGNIGEALNIHYEVLQSRLKDKTVYDSDVCVSLWNLLVCFREAGNQMEDIEAILDQLKWMESADPSELTNDQREIMILARDLEARLGRT